MINHELIFKYFYDGPRVRRASPVPATNPAFSRPRSSAPPAAGGAAAAAEGSGAAAGAESAGGNPSFERSSSAIKLLLRGRGGADSGRGQ